MSSLREECGVFGVFSPQTSDVASTAYYGLFALQHRGQESCGIVVNDDGIFQSYKDTGLVNDVFTPQILAKLGEGNMAVGHVRYGTTGGNDRSNAQPIVVNHIKGRMALAHNGNIVNCEQLRRELELEGVHTKFCALSALMFVVVGTLLLIVNLRSIRQEKEAEQQRRKVAQKN